VAANCRHVRDSARLQTAAMAELVYCHVRHINRVDRRLLVSDGVDDCCCRYVGFNFFPMCVQDCCNVTNGTSVSRDESGQMDV